MDELVKWWLKDVPYIYVPGKDYFSSKRYYFIHENTKIYTRDYKPFDLFFALQNKHPQELYLIPINTECGWALNYLMVMNPYALTGTEDFRISGEKIKYDRKFASPYVWLWSIVNRSGGWCSPHTLITGKGKRDFKISSGCHPQFLSPKKFEISEKVLDQVEKIDFERIRKENKIKPRYPQRNQEDSFTPRLTSAFKKRRWDSRVKPKPINYHWGQFKLLISEIEFLTSINTTISNIVVYAGAAPGDHIPYLAKMFPNILFILYDPLRFKIVPTPNIIIRQEFFTDKIAEMYRGMGIIFISDIRLAEERTTRKFIQHENQIKIDNQTQKEWLMMMQPTEALLKFRTPFLEGHTDYFDGDVWFQSFAPSLSAETRLKIKPGKFKRYNHQQHEEQLFYFNTLYRNKNFLDYNSFFGVNYDTYLAYVVLKGYLEKVKNSQSKPEKVVLGIILEIEKVMNNDIVSKLLL